MMSTFLKVVIVSSLFASYATSQDSSWSNWILATEDNLPQFQYKFQQTALKYYISPETQYVWSWNTYQELTGTYSYTTDGGITFNTFQCTGSESGNYGVGCSNGGGATQKVLPMDYNNDYVPSEGLAQICQDNPGIFSDDAGDAVCQTRIDIYFKSCSNALGCSEWILATSSNLAISFQYKFQQTAMRYFIGPITNYVWSWNTYQQQTGTYYYTINNGRTWDSILCSGSSEMGSYGVGCSNGGGATQKVLPIDYSNDYAPDEGLAQICQDQPGIFGSTACQPDIDVYFRESSVVLKLGEQATSHRFFEYIPYKDVIIMVLLFINVILIAVCLFMCSKRNYKTEYKLVSMQSDLGESDCTDDAI